MVPERILIVRLGHLGDVIHTLPAVTLLSQTWPDAKISWLIEPLSAPLIEHSQPMAADAHAQMQR